MKSRDVKTIPTLGRNATPEMISTEIRRAGCAIVESLLDADTVDAVAAEAETLWSGAPTGPDDFCGHQTRRAGNLIVRMPSVRPVLMHPSVLGTLDLVLHDHATNYQLNLTQLIAIGPDQPAQPVHRDQWGYDKFPWPTGFDILCATMWALTDFTEENGATRLVPGSHLLGDDLQYELSDTVPAEMPRGSVLFFLGSMYHGGGANNSTTTRAGLNIAYSLAWLRQEENQFLACTIDEARELPDDLLKLMGYERAAYSLGYFGDGQEPLEAVRGPGTVPIDLEFGRERSSAAAYGTVTTG